MEVHLIGPYPPPYGGVSVHLFRLQKRLLRAGHKCTVWTQGHSPRGGVVVTHSLRQLYHELRKTDRQALLHFHNHHIVAGLLAKTHRRVVFTMHNERVNTDLFGGRFPRQWAFRLASRRYFRNVPHIIAVSDWVRDEAVKFGFPPAALHVVCSYLRPEEEEAAHPDNTATIAPFREKFRYLATASAWALQFYKSEDMYGIDLCVEMLGLLKDERPELGLVLVIPQAKGTPYLKTLQDRAETLGVTDRILWLLEPGAYHPLQRRCDLFLRPTNTDGFGVTLAEAMEFGVPAIASDAVHRLEGCMLFRNRDATDLARKVNAALDNLPTLSEQAERMKEPDHFDEVLAVYESLM
ncbi:MAG: glycosyltransferase family 4 protein [Phycisphaerales bacterium]|nr:MAG: glycosyltransferase family 4 protein [Phycisphaerales bacterium]